MSTATIEFDNASPAYHDGQWEVAIEALTLRLAQAQNRNERFETLEKLGLTHFQRKDYPSARSCFERILNENFSPKQQQITRCHLGRCFLNEGDSQRARVEFEAIVSLGKFAVGPAHFGLACYYSSITRPTEALDHLEKAILADSSQRELARLAPELNPIRPFVRFEKILELEAKSSKASSRFKSWMERTLKTGSSAILWCIRACEPFSPEWLNSWARNLGRKILLRFFVHRAAQIHGLETRIVSVNITDEERVEVLSQLNDAIALIQRCSPRQYLQLKKNINSIMILPLSYLGEFITEYRECQLSSSLFDTTAENRESTIHYVASVLVHEACHARVNVMIPNPNSDPNFREEKLCRLEQKRFIEKAKADNELPWPSEYDTEYHTRFDYWNRWYYQNDGTEDVTSRFTSIMTAIQTGETEGDDQFLEHIWSQVDHYAEYAKDLSESLDSESRDATAWLNRGYERYAIRQYDLAIRDFQQACRLDDQDESLWRWLATVAFHAGQHEITASALTRVVELDPESSVSLEWLIKSHLKLNSIGNSNRDQLLELVDRFAQMNPFCHRAMILKSEVLRACGELEKALELMEQALVYNPESGKGLSLAVCIAHELGRWEIAQKYWDAYLRSIGRQIIAFEEPVVRQAVVLESTVVRDHVRLRVLYSLNNKNADLSELAEELLSKTSPSPQTIEGQYWNALIHFGAQQLSPTEIPDSLLPTSLAEEKILVREIKIPLRCFHESMIPKVLQTLPLHFDQANLDHVHYAPQFSGPSQEIRFTTFVESPRSTRTPMSLSSVQSPR